MMTHVIAIISYIILIVLFGYKYIKSNDKCDLVTVIMWALSLLCYIIVKVLKI